MDENVIKLKCSILACIVSTILFFPQDVTAEQPKMILPNGEFLFHLDPELRIDCFMNGARLHFSAPENTLLTTRSPYKITVSDDGTHTFRRRLERSADTGWYACAAEDVEIDDDFWNLDHSHDNISWVYAETIGDYTIDSTKIMVDEIDSADGLPPPLQRLIMVEGSPLVVPCRTTPFRWGPKLWQNFELVNLDRFASRYDWRIGFIMKRVEFVDGEAFLQCKLDSGGIDAFKHHNYHKFLVRYSNPKPKMITANASNEELLLQEGETLRIECYSEKNFSFVFPRFNTNSSSYEIVKNENGTSTFFRRSVVSEDTGWYGCTGLDIRDNYYPDFLVNFTRQGASWVYVYVNSSVPIVLAYVDPLDQLITYGHLRLIPCRPTSPGLPVSLEWWKNDTQTWVPDDISNFEPKTGFLTNICRLTFQLKVVPSNNLTGVYRCATPKPHGFVTNNLIGRYAALEIPEDELCTPVIWDVNNSSIVQPEETIIRIIGEDLQLSCQTATPFLSLFHISWTNRFKLLNHRGEINWTRHDIYDKHRFYLMRRTLRITNLSEADTGQYTCSFESREYENRTTSRDVEVFDKNGGRYIRLTKEEGAMQTTLKQGDRVTWLVDLIDFPSAEIKCAWLFANETPTDCNMIIPNCFEVSGLDFNTISREGNPQVFLRMQDPYILYEIMYIRLCALIGSVMTSFDIIVNCQEPPTAEIISVERTTGQEGQYYLAMHAEYMEMNTDIVDYGTPVNPNRAALNGSATITLPDEIEMDNLTRTAS